MVIVIICIIMILFCSAVLHILWKDGTFDQSNVIGMVLCGLTILLSAATICLKIM